MVRFLYSFTSRLPAIGTRASCSGATVVVAAQSRAIPFRRREMFSPMRIRSTASRAICEGVLDGGFRQTAVLSCLHVPGELPAEVLSVLHRRLFAEQLAV